MKFDYDEVRSQLTEHIVNNPTSIRAISKDIGVSADALADFLENKTKPYLKVMLLIKKFLNNK